MRRSSWLAASTFLLLGAMMAVSGCVVHDGPGYNQGYKEGYWDREHNRYWHENGWHECGEGDAHCR
jgi:hypothetical protein